MLPAAALALGLSASFAATPKETPLPATVEEALATGRTEIAFGLARRAAEKLRRATGAWPQDPLLLPLYGVACAQIGDYPCTVISTEGELLDGDRLIQPLPVRAHALRMVGRGQEAADLRRSALLVRSPKPASEAILWAAIGDDLRETGDLEGAWEAAQLALATDPTSTRAYGLLAELALDEGDIEEAEFQLFLAEFRGAGPLDLPYTRARHALETLPPDEANSRIRELNRSLRSSNRDPEMALLLAESYRRAGSPDNARKVFDRPLWQTNHEVWHPQVLAMLALTRAETGDIAGAQQALDRAASTYPRHPAVLAVIEALEGWLAPQGGSPGPN